MLAKFRKRSFQKELLDEENIPADQLFRNLEELDTINTFLGGHGITVSGLSGLTGKKDRVYSVIDIGCGGGDTLKVLAKWASQSGVSLRLTGLDINRDVVAFARQNCREFPEIDFVQGDYREYIQGSGKTDIIISSLFCHHLNDEELTEFMSWSVDNCREGFLINDLHRHPLAYYSIWLISRLFGGSALLRNDAPLSVLRGFKRKELLSLLGKTAGAQASITWKWAFRYMVVFKHPE